jgi:hypothetical protein
LGLRLGVTVRFSVVGAISLRCDLATDFKVQAGRTVRIIIIFQTVDNEGEADKVALLGSRPKQALNAPTEAAQESERPPVGQQRSQLTTHQRIP